ncbi:hypothetical protein [Oscillatoria sp. FACHB-1407]|uniref:hypothetical protein n=1 Tax=Oscillatoria sp. FACHB-1407 TaxID=2692847 RepID=UPI0018EFE388|nr:hypothetical protein [Oscillatoria sp. FACHB-1407]
MQTTESMSFMPSALAEVQTNEELIELWLYGKSPHTVNAYLRDIKIFLPLLEISPFNL